MNVPSTTVPLWRERGSLYYLAVCLGALVVIVLTLEARGLEAWSFLPLVLGIAGMAMGWGTAPVMLLISVSICLSIESNYMVVYAQRRLLSIPDLILSAAVLAYVISHFRLQALTRAIMPPMTKPRHRSPETPIAPDAHKASTSAPTPTGPQPHRSPSLVTPAEVGMLLLSLPFWAGVAQLARRSMPTEWGNPGLPPPVWRLVLLAWIVGIAFVALAAALNLWTRLRMSPLEAAILMQDVVWQDTRGEARRLHRWLAWFSVRRTRKNLSRRQLKYVIISWIVVSTILLLSLYFIIDWVWFS